MKPEHIFHWAELDTDGDGNPLKSYPPVEIYQTGLLKGEPVARLWFNQALNNFSEWIQHLSGNVADGGAEPIGTIRMIATASLGSFDPLTVWSGTWVNRGTDTIAGVGITVFEKTSLTPILPKP